ncbi:MAG: DUF4011 domain-containing protein [Lachnospiraceae bacterium]|nr:DUF4011 domain-containing protein [Lachnospiraceae bacterium]
MDAKKLERWAQLLLDTGKRNNLINFKDTKASTAEVVCPDAATLYERCLSVPSFEIFDPKISDDEDDEEAVVSANQSEDETQEGVLNEKLKKSDYIDRFSSRIHKSNQVLVYAKTPNPITAIKNIDKKARDFLEETGVNVAYMAFGFVYWRESETSSTISHAPLLLVPVSLKNESAVKPYFIELTEDDVVVNPTFSYMLEAQYGIKLPVYEDDELLNSYLDKVRSLVSKLHWEVTAECKIGIFSFLKINMYYDLMNNQQKILKNDNVRILLGENVADSNPMSDQGVGHVENEIIDLHTVVDADSSQIEAIEMVKSGKSFVLQGPPGTGKSQTITNIIAECLHDGKKVLFVSEKLAALNVVFDKLKKAGLDEFCLELHSFKSSKKEVIAELCRTLRAGRSVVSSRADAEVQAKAKLQEQLDLYAEELHKPVPLINKTLYQLYESYAASRSGKELKISVKDIATKGETYLNEASSLLEQYEEYVPSIGDNYKQNEWYGYKGRNGSFETQSTLKKQIQEIITGLQDIIPLINECRTAFSLELKSLADVEKYARLLGILSETQHLSSSGLKKENQQKLMNSVVEMTKLSDQIIPIRNNLDANFDESIYKIDGQNGYNKLTKLYTGFFSRLFNPEYKGIIKDLRMSSKTGKKYAYQKAVNILKSLMEYQSLTASFIDRKEIARDVLEIENISIDTDWNRLKAEIETVKNCHDSGLNFESLINLTNEEFSNYKPEFGKHSKNLTESLNLFIQSVRDFQKEFETKCVSFETIPIEELLSRLQKCSFSVEKIENWIRFEVLLEQMESRDLLTFVDDAIENGVPSDLTVETYKRVFFKQWINHIIYSNPIFANFTRISHDNAVEKFASKDRLQFDISKAQIRQELSAKRPSLDMMAGGSAVSILLREGEKKRKQKSIRKLLEETGELVQVIKPCFLMSPLSVSTFLSENGIAFDTVVFDEASQIFPQDAIGAIYRGKQLIVVGDSKQMPPSNFFNSSVEIDDDDEETGDVTDFESILDLCSTSLPQLRLKWHYRSHYEQLIYFSNKNFYESTLVTFPSSTQDHKGIGVDYFYVDGLFDRKSHTNRKEAEFIVDLIYKNINEYPNRSLGVVAFSVAQQDLIDRLLSKRRQEDSSKEWFFKHDETVKEPFFIKNLETVQGDERDTIIFSVAYGKDVQGRLLHNFGPLNRVGGERRLNVAVTRAKDNVQLVSSMHGTDIDLKRTSAEGARLLREYLDYAENGEIALQRSISVNPFEQFDSDFEMDVCEFLREHGFTVDMQVGCSGYRIDLGLKQPNSSDYVLAIECDGATYHSSKNARDRDRLRQEVLERMGWRFYRIWSTDWFKNNAVEKERLLNAATEAIHLGHYVKSEKKETVEKKMESFEFKTQPQHLAFPEYKEADIFSLRDENFYSVSAYVRKIMQIEAPESEEYLLKRICYIYGREKVTNVVRQQFNMDMRGCERLGIIRKNGFLYFADQKTFSLRVPGVKRDVKYIALEELAAGMLFLVRQNVTAEKDGLFKTLASLLGFTRMGDAMYERFEQALRAIKNKVVIENNIISLKQ